MYAFNHHRPATVEEAVALLRTAEDGKLLAGGQTLIPTLKHRLAQPSDVIDLGGIAELRGIRDEGNAIVIGAMTRHAEIAGSDIVRQGIPGLAGLAGMVGDAQVRNMGTLGGSIANNDPSADCPAAILGLGATVVTKDRAIGSDAFFTGMFETSLGETEVILSIRFPKPLACAYVKFPNPASRYAIVGVFVARTADGVRVAVTGAAPCVFRADAMEAALTAGFSVAALTGISVDPADFNEDIHASREYRAHLVTVMARRAVSACL